MKKLIDCGNKVVGKLVSKADLDMLVQEARALEAEGLTPVQAERQAVRDALDQVTRNGEDILRQIRAQRPQVYKQASDFWDKETIRKAGMVPPPLPRFVTEGMPAPPAEAPRAQAGGVPVDAIVTSHDANGGSTVNSVHGDLAFTNSFSVSIFPDLTTTVPGKNITPEQIHAFAAKAQAAGVDTGSPNISIGTWYDAESDTTYLDVAFTTTDRAQAVALGQQFNQKAIFDLNAMEEIATGGTGAVEGGLPSVEERLGMASSLGYVPAREGTEATAPGTPAPAEGGVPAGAQGGIPEAGRVQEEGQPTEPDEVASPLSDAAQEAVNSLPEGQRAGAQKAFAQTDYDPLADMQRRRGNPVSKPAGKSASPEKNTKLVADASKYGLFEGKTPSEVLSAIASDPKQPRWRRLVADLLVQLGIGDGVTIRAVNNPNASWAGVYNSTKSEVLINLAFGGTTRPDLAHRLIHELVHHGTMSKLDAQNEADLTPSELAARDELQKIYGYVRSQPEFEGMYGTVALREFVSEIFASEELRNKLNSIKPDGKVSLWQRFTDAIMRLLIGDRLPGMRPGSLLEKAIAEAINVAGSPMAEGPSGSEVAAQEVRTRAARLINEFPAFQEHILNTVAPTAPSPEVAPMVENNMGITEAEKRELDHEAAFYSETERAAIEVDVDKMAKGIKATKAEVKAVKDRLEAYIKYYRAKHPAKAGWANKEIKPLGLEELKRGRPNKANPTGITFKVKFAKSPLTFARDAAKKLIPRFLRQSKADAAAGKPVVDNPEWAKRRQELGDKMFSDLQEIMSRRNEGGDKGRIAQVILDQINWYRDMREHLRVTFGSMSDYVADVIAGLSPITDVPGNWANFIEYFQGVMKGRYDDIYRKFDAYIAEDPENRTASTWRDAGGEMPLKLNKAKFGTNGPNVMMAGLDIWRAVQTGTAPKARNFGLNLIGQSLKATIDRWAGRYLQRMHAPTWRLPAMIEADVKGEHMAGENVELVSGDFGMGQDVFEDVAKRLQESGIPEFRNVSAADLQAILWFAEKEVWEMKGWTQIMGAGSSMNALAQATAAQRYEAGTMPGVFSKDKQLTGEIIGLRDKINEEQHVLGAKMVPSVNIHDGEESKTFDGEWITHPEYDPENTIAHVAEAVARLGKDGAHISRVIVNPYEANPNRTPGLHIFFRKRVGEAEVKVVLDKLMEAGINNGITLAVDPRVRPEIIKSLDPAMGANQYNGVRVQYIPEYEAAGGMDRNKIEKAFTKAMELLGADISIAESRILYYDTLVLKKGIDYDSRGKLTKNVSDSRARAWAERARREGSEAATRRDNARKAIEDRKRADRELELRIKREEEERIARYEAFQRSQPVPDAAIDGGVDPPSVAAMRYEDEAEPTRDPHGGRASLVRSMVNRLRFVSRDREGIEIPQSEQEVRAPAGAFRSENQGRTGSAPVWKTLGETFRKREAALYRRLGEAADLTETENPRAGKYALSQKFFNYLSGKEVPSDPGLQDAVTELRKEIPTIPASAFESHEDLDSGTEADVYHDEENGVVYKLYKMGSDGALGGYVPGKLRRRRDGEVVIGAAGSPSFRDLIERMERSNSHGLTPSELVAVTPEGDAVFAQPFVAGTGVTGKNIGPALARAGIHLLSEMGGTSGVAKVGDRWVIYDDLHFGNVRSLPGGRVEVIDANNRELDAYEVADLYELGKMPEERPLSVAAMSDEVKDGIDLSVAPMAGRGSRARWPWPWQKKPEKAAGYKPGGMWTPDAALSKPIGGIVAEHKQRGKSIAVKVQLLVRELENALKKGYGKGGPDPAQLGDVQVALGNLDNRLTQQQYQQSLQIKDRVARQRFIDAAHLQNVADAKARQQVALGNLPDIVRRKVIELRNELDTETKELLKDPGLDADLKARISSELGVFLHSNSFQHFENDLWGKYVGKSDDPDAQRIRRNAEALFKNEIIGEKALEYQKANPGTTDAAALAYASALDLTQMVKNRLAAYLRKDASEVTRIHLLTGKLPVAKSEAGKLLSLNRENIPQEVKELWGQWTDAKVNFVKTYTLLANHNADIRMQNKILAEGTVQGYLWKRGVSPGSPAEDLVPLGSEGDYGPLSDVYGPQLLKDGLANYNKPPVQDLLVNLNRWSLMMKTVGNIGSAIHNFFGNPAFTITNGNLFWAVLHMPKGLLKETFKSFEYSLRREAPRLHGAGSQAARNELTELIDLGVFDSDIATNTIKGIYRAAQAGAKLEEKMGLGAGLGAVMKVLQTEGAAAAAQHAGKKWLVEPAGVVARPIWATAKGIYVMADNFWKYFNYKIELAKQQWIHSENPSPPSLDEMKRMAASRVLDTLPSYSRVPEAVQRGLSPEGGIGKWGGTFFTFQTEAVRTAVMNGTHAWKEATGGVNWKEREIGALRAAGMIAMAALPSALAILAKKMFDYDDDDERALRASLPEYQQNSSFLVMLPRDKDGKPRYMDLSYMNPYGILMSPWIAGERALHEGRGMSGVAEAATWSVAKPVVAVQPGLGTLMDAYRNSDSMRGGLPIYNEQDTLWNKSLKVAARFAKGFAPGTAMNMWKTYQASQGYEDPRTGKPMDLTQEITAGLLGQPRIATLEPDRAMATHVGNFEREMRQAKQLLTSKLIDRGRIHPGEVAAAYEQANEQAFETFREMHRNYRHMLNFGMDEGAAYDAMRIGFGTEIRKSGLSKNQVRDVEDGVFYPIEISDVMEEDVLAGPHPERYDEYMEAFDKAKVRDAFP